MEPTRSVFTEASSFHRKGAMQPALQALFRRLLSGDISSLWSEAERRQLEAMASDQDPEMLSEDLFRFGERVEAEGRYQASTVLYKALQDVALSPSLNSRVETRLRVLQERGSFAERGEFLLGNFARESCDPKLIFPMLAGTAVYGLVRAATLTRIAGSTRAAWWTRGMGARLLAGSAAFAVEVPAFVASGRALGFVTAPAMQEGPGLGHELGSALLSLGALKFFGFAGETGWRRFHGIDARGSVSRAAGIEAVTRVFSAQAATFVGLLGAHRIEERLGWRPDRGASLEISDTLAAMLSMGVGASLGRRLLGTRFSAFQSELAWRPEAGGRSNPGLGLAPKWHFIGAERGNRPLRPSLDESDLFPTSKNYSFSLGKGSLSSGQNLRREVEKILDHPRIDVAWTMLKRWGEYENRLRPEDFAYFAVKMARRLEAKGEMPPLLATLMMGRLLPHLLEEEATPILIQLQGKLENPQEKMVEGALESLAAAASRAAPGFVATLLPSLERVSEREHDWIPVKACATLAAYTAALPAEQRLSHVLRLESRLVDLGLSPVSVLPRAIASLAPQERAQVGRRVEVRLFSEDAGAPGEWRETLSNIFPELPFEEQAALRQRLQDLAESPRAAGRNAAVEILGEWAGNFNSDERAALLRWIAPQLKDRQLTRRMTALDTAWKLVMREPPDSRFKYASVLDEALRDPSSEMRRAALNAWGLLAHDLKPEEKLAVAGKLLSRRGDTDSEIRNLAWEELGRMGGGSDSSFAKELLRQVLNEAWIGKVPLSFLKSMAEKLPARSVGPEYDPQDRGGLSRFVKYHRAHLPLEANLWKSYLSSPDPESFIQAAVGDLGAFRRGRNPDLADSRQVLLSYAAMEVSEGLDFRHFRKSLKGNTPPPPFLAKGFRSPVREQVSLHGRIDKGVLRQGLAPLEKFRELGIFHQDFEKWIEVRRSELRPVREDFKNAIPNGFGSMSLRSTVAAVQGLMPRLWEHRKLPAVRELLARFGLFLAWQRVKASPQAARMMAFRQGRISSKALGESLMAMEEFYRDTVGDVFSELKLQADGIPFIRSQRRQLSDAISRMGREGGEAIEVEFVPSKAEVDRFFAYVSDDCNRDRQRVIFRPDFQLLRMVSGERLRGLIYLQEASLDGKKSLVLGIQPRSSWQVDHRDLLRVVERELPRIAEERGYEAVFLMADDNQQSNRKDMLEAIRERDYPMREFQKGVSGAVFEGKSFLVVWERNPEEKASKSFPKSRD